MEAGTSTPSGNTGILSAPLSTVEQFYSNHGVPINEDVSYPYSTRYNIRVGDDAHNLFIAKGEKTASLNFDREIRFYSTFGFDRGRWFGNFYRAVDEKESPSPGTASANIRPFSTPANTTPPVTGLRNSFP